MPYSEDDSWHNYLDNEIPKNASTALVRQLRALDIVTKQVRIAAGTYYLFLALARDASFATSINKTSVAAGTRIVVGTLMRDLVIALASIFDQDTDATDIRRIINALLNRENEIVFKDFHDSFVAPIDRLAVQTRLARYRQKINWGNLGNALARIVDLRKQAVAHHDLEPDFVRGRPLIRDIDHVLASACIIVKDANLFAVGRSIDTAQTRNICRKSALAFAEAIRKGIN